MKTLLGTGTTKESTSSNHSHSKRLGFVSCSHDLPSPKTVCVCLRARTCMSDSEKETSEYINSRPCLKCLVMINVSFQFSSQAYVFLQQMNFLEQSRPERMQLFGAPRTSGKLLWRAGSSPLTKQMFSTVAGKQDFFFFRCVFHMVHIHFRKHCVPLKGSRAHGALGDSANGH